MAAESWYSRLEIISAGNPIIVKRMELSKTYQMMYVWKLRFELCTLSEAFIITTWIMTTSHVAKWIVGHFIRSQCANEWKNMDRLVFFPSVTPGKFVIPVPAPAPIWRVNVEKDHSTWTTVALERNRLFDVVCKRYLFLPGNRILFD